jgi:hypothetical protein
MKRILCLAGAFGLFAAPAFAAVQHYSATMSPASEVPPVSTSGTGAAEASYDPDTHKLTYTVTFSGLSGPATMAHFHGPAQPGANAGVVEKLGMAPTSPITGSVTLTDEQAQQLASGLWYVNVHTANNPKGELRGQLQPAK